MENVLVAVIIIFILLFGGLTMSSAIISAQQTMVVAEQESAVRANEIAHTALTADHLRVLNSGSLIEVVVRNDGAVKLTDFQQWDVFLEYYDGTPTYHAGRLSYDASASNNGTWSVGGLYLNWAQGIAETYEPGILNPAEEIVLKLNVSPAVGVEQAVQVSVATDSGITSSIMGTRNAPPTLALDTGMKVALSGSAPITPSELLAQDIDNSAADLTYIIVSAPQQGSLAPTSFTQAQIDDGEVVYTHSGTDADSFSFTVSDGIDVIGPFTFPITVNAPPVLDTNAGLTLPADTTAPITAALLHVSDADDSPDKLTYTVTQFPANGTLNLGSTFTQADIDGNLLTYTHIGTDADLFKFVVSDGCDVIGTYSFVITLVSQEQS